MLLVTVVGGRRERALWVPGVGRLLRFPVPSHQQGQKQTVLLSLTFHLIFFSFLLEFLCSQLARRRDAGHSVNVPAMLIVMSEEALPAQIR